ncbi:MAG: RNA polymerase sigma factor [Gaiellaceae bacterium]
MGDAELIRAARRDPAAFCRLYERHAVRLRGWLRGQTGSTEAANDLTAETFAQALVSLRRFRGADDAAAAAWLYGIARNLLFQYRRRARVETASRRRLGMPVRDYGGFDEVEEREDALAAAPALAAALAGLPAGERAAVELRVLDELPYEDVASRLEIGEPAARQRVSRALRTLGLRLKGAER